MRVAIETMGTRGDVQPYLALARALMARGHDVQLAAPEQFASFARDNGVPFVGLPAEFLDLLDSPEAKSAMSGAGKGFSGGFKLLKYVRPMMMRLLEDEWSAVRSHRPDLLIYHPKSFGSPHMAAALGVPHMLASPLPGFTPTAAFPSPMLPMANLGLLNKPSHLLAIHGASMLFAKDLRTWRQANGMDGKRPPSAATGTLYAYSPSVLPVPDDWGSDVLVSGYWFLDAPDWQPDEGLRSFLGAGDKPVYIGFGSMPGLDPVKLTATIVEGLSRAGKRGVLASGWGALAGTTLPPHVHLIREAPHDRLLPLMSAAIHHGGAGSTAAALRAGLPTTIMPFFGDQPFWARRVAALGVGPAALDRDRLTADAVAAALTAMNDEGMRTRAATLGQSIRNEDGVRAAVEFIEKRTAAVRSAP